MVDSISAVDAGRRTGRVGRWERSQRKLGKPWARVIVPSSVPWARSCAAMDMESIILAPSRSRATTAYVVPPPVVLGLVGVGGLYAAA
jgi:hypothetical protein